MTQMRLLVSSIPLALAGCLAGCASPAAPSSGCQFTGVYLLDITPASSCAATGTGWFEVGTVQLRVIPAQSGSQWRFTLPNREVEPPTPVANSGSLVVELTITGTGATGTIGGWGLANNAFIAIVLRASADNEGPGPATGLVTPGSRPTIDGKVSGELRWSVYQSSTVAVCTAADHGFALRAAPT